MPTAHEYFSEQFEKWEKRGRGWQVFDQPISPEPPFVPFQFRSMEATSVVDNGVRPSFLGSLFGFGNRPEPPPEIEPEEDPEPTTLERNSLIELQVALPADLDIARDEMEQLFRNLSLCHEPIAFELLGTPQRVLAQFVTSETDAPLVRKQLTAYFPDVLFREQTETLLSAVETSTGDDTYVVEFGLEREFMLSLESGKIDPFVGIVSALAELQAGELALFQVLFEPVNKTWADSIVRSVSLPDGKPLFVNAPELTSGAEQKTAKSLYAVVVRMFVCANTHQRLQEITREFAGALCAFANPQGNALIPLDNEDYGGYSQSDHIGDVLLRQTRRSGMILNSDELFNFVHLPSSAVRTPALQRDTGRTKAAPETKTSNFIIGDNEHNGDIVPVYLSPDQRVRHTHIIGSTGTGKSTLLFNLIRQDIENGEGVALLDPHGDLVDQLLGVIPENRIDDVVLVNLSDTDFPIGFNILQAHSEDEKALLASDLIGVLRRFSTSWGDQMDIVLLNAILAFLESKQGGTLADLRRFLLETPYRNQFLETVPDLEIKYYWREVFPKLGGGKSIGSVLTRLQDFFSRKPLRNMVSQRENKLDFADIMDNRKIFLARLPEGLNGAENVHMLGALLVSKFQQTAMARQSQVAASRKDFWLYIDEFDHFISPSMASILTGARKYRLGLTLGHQELHQLQSEPKVASAVNSSVCTRIVLRVGDDDAKKLADGFASFDADSLKNLEKYHAIARIERNDCDFNLALRPPELPDKNDATDRREQVIAKSREQYGTPRAEVEAAWLVTLGITDKPEPPAELSSDDGKPLKPKPPSKTTVVPVVAEVPKVAEVPQVAEIPKSALLPAQDETLAVTPVTERRHEVLKKEITAEAESLDYTVETEKPMPPYGQVDLILTRGERSIACEVSDTTLPKDEAEHIRLRLKAGFKHVAVIADSPRKLKQIRELFLASSQAADAARVGFYSPKKFIDQLYAWSANDPAGGVEEKGKLRKQNFDFSDDDDQRASDRQMLAELSQIMAANRKKRAP